MQHTSEHGKKPNNLVNETSPYLLQHLYNPVDWHPWNPSTLKQAVKEDKLLIISVGYAACHWCHVMERESFEDSVVAVKMNTNYLPIKVDREERPDVDQIYMNAAYMVTGRGGWPLNAIALPDGRPIYAGTYFPKNKWIEILDYFAQLYKDEPERLEEQAEKITRGIRELDKVPDVLGEPDFNRQMLDEIWMNWKDRIDFQYGGREGAPKFVMPNNWEFLLRYYRISEDPQVLEAIETTLREMAYGGLYDQLGGGFARYSTDSRWKVPHFEKMLYDNGQLVSLYAQAYQLTGNPLYQQIIEETLTFIERELTDESNGFYSSLDADSEGEEGKFYVWEAAEIKEALGDEADLFMDYYSLTEHGNWEHGKNILFRRKSDDTYLEKYEMSSAEELHSKLQESKVKLMNIRDQRIRPGLDDKILTSWNALMLKGYIDAYRALGHESYLEMALKNARFILEKCKRPDGGLNRNYKAGKSNINGFLIDYSTTIEALVDLYEVTFEESYLEEARSFAEYAIQHFYDTESRLFYYTSDEDDALISRTRELTDNVISGSNSSMVKGLLYLGHYFYEERYINMAREMIHIVQSDMIKNGPFYANWASVATHFVDPLYEVAIVGDQAQGVRSQFDKHYLPQVLFLGGRSGGSLQLLQNKFVERETMIYVCVDKSCKLPVQSVDAAMEQMR